MHSSPTPSPIRPVRWMWAGRGRTFRLRSIEGVARSLKKEHHPALLRLIQPLGVVQGQVKNCG